ncbi:hypothetical protein EI555_008627, partial [Monodon monoceros]
GRMAPGNDSSVTEFILLGLTQQPELQLPLFFIFLGIYLVTVVGNIGLIILIGLNPHLHTPMYYFLFNFSFIDLCCSSLITPKILMSFVNQNVSMSHQVCLTQMVGAYVMGLVGTMAHTGCMLRLSFCDGNIIDHYTCDIPPLLQLSCASTYINELVVFVVVGVNVIVPSLTNSIYYTLILSNILCICSTAGGSKAFSTCSSHIILDSLWIISIHPFPAVSLNRDKVSTVFYTIVRPMMNLFIYSMRNKDVQVALSKTLHKRLRMLARNDSLVTEFILAGLTDHPELQQPLFYLFLMIYIVTMVDNLGLIILIGLNSHLHTPMYYLVFNLSFIDLCCSSVFTPQMLMNFVFKKNIISYVGRMTQLFFFLFFVISECYMLTSMAYDRYVAICTPLLYKVTMFHKVCLVLSLAVYVMGFTGASAHTGTYVSEVVVLIVMGINITVPSFTILVSYIFILTSILHIKSAQGRSKAFSTCSSHIIALSFFGSAAFMYLKYSSPGSMDLKKIYFFYTNVVPMVNPLIYILRNKDIKVTLRKSLFKNPEENHITIVQLMAMENAYSVTEFILMGFTDQPELQLLLFFLFLVNYMVTVTAMACDHYVSICKPLLYTVTMSPQVHSLLISGSYVMGFAGVVVHTGCMIRLIFCDSNIINHYLCDIFHLLQLSCSSTYANELVVSVVVGTVVMIKVGPKSSALWLHIITAGLFYRLGLLIHVKPSFAGSVGQGKFFSVFYANVVPMLNPLIYSVRNKDVKIAMKKTMKRITN